MATFCPLNSHRTKRSRALERSDEAIKDDFHRSRFLIPVANASTGDVYVTTPCICHTCYTDKVPLVSLHEKCLTAGASTENEPSSTTTLSHGQSSYAAEGSILLYL